MPLVAACLLLFAGRGAPPPLKKVEKAFANTQFERVIVLGTALASDPSVDRVRLFELVAFAHFYLDDTPAAAKMLGRLFELQPEFRADARQHPPGLITFVEDTRRAFLARRSPPPASLPVIVAAPAPASEPASAPIVKEIVVAPPVVPTSAPTTAPVASRFNPLALIPFGIGQLAMGDHVAGAVFLGLDAALFAANIALYVLRVQARIGVDAYLDEPRAFRLQIAQDVAAGALVLVGIIGFIDAVAFSQRRVERKARINAAIAPTSGGLTMSVGSRF